MLIFDIKLQSKLIILQCLIMLHIYCTSVLLTLRDCCMSYKTYSAYIFLSPLFHMALVGEMHFETSDVTHNNNIYYLWQPQRLKSTIRELQLMKQFIDVY